MKKVKKVKLPKDKNELMDCCVRCGCLDIKKLSTGEVLCQNKMCLAVTKYDFETNTLDINIKVNEK